MSAKYMAISGYVRLSRVTRTGLNESLATRMTTIVSLHVNA